jgi:hypothetical protein
MAGYYREHLKQLLETPIKKYQKPALSPLQENHEVAKRIEAAFAYYRVGHDLADLTQWQELALCLLGDHFRGCRGLTKGVGGRPRDKHADLKRKLAETFEQYRTANEHFSARAAATNFLRKYRQDCEAAGYTDAKSFAQAMQQLKNRQ